MDHQGPGRGRPATDTRGQAAWSWLEDGAEPEDRPDRTPGSDTQPVPRRGTATQPVPGSGSGAQPVLGYGSGAQRVLGPGTGPQRLIGTGADPVTGTAAQPVTGTGAQPVTGGLGLPGPYDRTPPQGFAPGRGPSGATESGSWSTVTGPIPSIEQATDGGYGAFGPAEDNDQADDATNPFARLKTPAPAAAVAPAAAAVPAGRRRSGKTDSAKTDSAKANGRPGSRTSRLGSRAALLAAASVVVLAGVGFGGYKYLYEARVNAPVSPTLRLPTSAPGSPGFDKSLGKWQHIGSRTTDPDALTIEGLYPPQFVLNGSSYIRTAATVTKNCSAAVYGANLQAALQSAHCSQVARASYVSGNNLMMGTVGVINLNTSAAATKAGQATGPQEIIIPLAAKKGITKKLGHGTGVVQAEVKGHYLILMWAEFTSLKSPSTAAARTQLEQFATSLVTGTANINLSTRMLSGKS